MAREGSDPGPAIEWARTAYELGNYQGCVDFIEGLPGHQRVPELARLKALCLDKLRHPEVPQPPSKLERAMELWMVEKFDDALRACDELLGEDPRDAVALRWKGQCLVSLGRGPEAKRALEAALELDPADELARKLLRGL